MDRERELGLVLSRPAYRPATGTRKEQHLAFHPVSNASEAGVEERFRQYPIEC